MVLLGWRLWKWQRGAHQDPKVDGDTKGLKVQRDEASPRKSQAGRRRERWLREGAREKTRREQRTYIKKNPGRVRGGHKTWESGREHWDITPQVTTTDECMTDRQGRTQIIEWCEDLGSIRLAWVVVLRSFANPNKGLKLSSAKRLHAASSLLHTWSIWSGGFTCLLPTSSTEKAKLPSLSMMKSAYHFPLACFNTFLALTPTSCRVGSHAGSTIASWIPQHAVGPGPMVSNSHYVGGGGGCYTFLIIHS